MARRRLSVLQYRQIILHLRDGESQRDIKARGLASRKKIRKIGRKAFQLGWLDTGRSAPTEMEVSQAFEPERQAAFPLRKTSKVEPYRKEVEAWVREGTQATAIYSALKRKYAFKGSYGSVLRFVQGLKAKEPPEAFVTLDFEPGELAQVDFGSGPQLPDPVTNKPRKTHVFVMTLAYSRHMYAELVWDQKVETWLKCIRNAWEFFGGSTRRIGSDNLKAAIVRACYRDPLVQKAYYDFCKAYGVQISPIAAGRPNHNGRVESGVGYVKGSFFGIPKKKSRRKPASAGEQNAGPPAPPLRVFRGIGDANHQLLEWVLGEAGNRVHGTTHKIPLCVFAETEKPALKPLPEQRPEVVSWSQATLHPSCYVTFEKAYYSAPYRLVQKKLDLRVTESVVELYLEHVLVALHPRATHPGQHRKLDEHFPPDKIAFLQKTPQWCLKQAHQIGPDCGRLVEELFKDRVLDRLRAAQGVVGLRRQYGNARVNAACRRALAYDNITYRAVSQALKKGLDQLPLEEDGGGQLQLGFIDCPRFARDIGQMLAANERREP